MPLTANFCTFHESDATPDLRPYGHACSAYARPDVRADAMRQMSVKFAHFANNNTDMINTDNMMMTNTDNMMMTNTDNMMSGTSASHMMEDMNSHLCEAVMANYCMKAGLSS
jgi:hypothetical protein